MVTPATKKYLFIMYEIAHGGTKIRAVEIARGLNINKASVSDMLPKMIDDDFIKRSKDGTIEFTPNGIKYAGELYLRYITLYKFFERLGSSAENARSDAITCISSLSDENTENITDLILGEPKRK